MTASLILNEYVTNEDFLRGAFKALENGADAVMTPRSMDVVEMLTKEDIPVTDPLVGGGGAGEYQGPPGSGGGGIYRGPTLGGGGESSTGPPGRGLSHGRPVL